MSAVLQRFSWLIIAAILLLAGAGGAYAALPERLDGADIELFDGARMSDDPVGYGASLELPVPSYATWKPEARIREAAGTISLWVKPLWTDGTQHNHTIASFRWNEDPHSYFVLSQGWSQSQLDGRMFVTVDASRAIYCATHWPFPYTWFLPNQWTMVAVTWTSGSPGKVQLFVDGKSVCDREVSFGGDRESSGAIFLGSDRAATGSRFGGTGDMIIERLVTADRAMSVEEIRRNYLAGGGSFRAKWVGALSLGRSVIAPAHERRVMQDEDTTWASSRSEILRRVQRLKTAGFNVYMPNVWNGGQIFCQSSIAPMSPTIRDPIDATYDPLDYLIAESHKAGIEVHPWLYMVGRSSSDFPAVYLDGAPPGGFNVHSTAFRDFIVSVALEVARRHDIDGINLDYIRAIGPCTNVACLDAYRTKYGRSLAEDWKLAQAGTSIPELVEWNQRAVSDIVNRIGKGTKALRPRAVVTIDSVFFDYNRRQQGLDEERWLRNGSIDAVMNMSYDDPVDVGGLDRAVMAVGAAHVVVTLRNYDLFAGEVFNRSGPAMADYVGMIRARWPGVGIGVYHYMHMDADQQQGFAGPFAMPASPVWLH